MAKSMATAESRSEDPGRRGVFIMGYHPEEPGVLQAWDTKSESRSSETQSEICMMAHSAEGVEGPDASNASGEPLAFCPEGNQPGAGQAGTSRQPQHSKHRPEEPLHSAFSTVASSPRPSCCPNTGGSPPHDLSLLQAQRLDYETMGQHRTSRPYGFS